MDALDAFCFMLWSAGLVAFDFTGWQVISCQCTWLALFHGGRKLVDRCVGGQC
jgi:hypothetical protein